MPRATTIARTSDAAHDRPAGARLAFGEVLWRLALLLLLLSEVGFWSRTLAHRPWIPLGRRLAVLLFRTPYFCCMSFFAAAVITVAADLLVRTVVRPMVRLWVNPPMDAETGSFHLEAHEVVEATTPARRAVGRRWLPGTFIRTSRRLGFVPRAWDAEPWFLRLGDVADCELAEGKPWAWGFIVGLPERLRVIERDGEVESFIVPDPCGTFTWVAQEVAATSAAEHVAL